MQQSPKTRYDYQSLDQLLVQGYDPVEIGHELDGIMSDLVESSVLETHDTRSLVRRHYLLRLLRNIFWELKKNS